MKELQSRHIEDVLNAARGRTCGHDKVIQESWQRCVSNHRLDPACSPDIYVHTDVQIRERRTPMEGFLRTARFGLESLYREVAGLGYVLLLTDANGVTIDFIGDPTYGNQLRNAGLYLGSLWSEDHAGTNGVGTCIATGSGLVVHQSDHFSTDHIDLTCTAAPIFDPQGQLAAVLDISALTSPKEKTSQYLALALVTNYAHRIENATLISDYKSNWLLTLSHSPEFLSVDPEYILALDDNGRICAFNGRGAQLLRSELEVSREVDLKAYSFENVFECKLSKLGGFVRPSPMGGTVIRLKRSGKTLFLFAHEPRPKVRRAVNSGVENLPRPLAELTKGDAQILGMLDRVAKLATSPISLLLRGETGSGKERLAQAIHEVSGRGEFVPVNCAAIPDTLIESELFGYEAGAFTGARSKGKMGLVTRSSGGTLFLDEIGDMPVLLQTRLLRALSEKEVVPLGGSKPIKVDLRVIAATNRDLKSAIKSGLFREDLYYRLSGFEMTIPPLRERSDLCWLVSKIAATRTPMGAQPPIFSPEVLDVFKAHTWRGNIRELINVIDYCVAVYSGPNVTLADLPHGVFGNQLVPSNSQTDDSEATSLAPGDDLSVDVLRDQLIRRQWNISQVARDLNLDRTTIHRRMKKLGIVSPNRSD